MKEGRIMHSTPKSSSLGTANDLVRARHAPVQSSCSKENVNVNKSENSKLSLEPQQMKRKKKGRECNFRKSLAWDRAFFTEEGVLDALELSILTGASPKGLPTHKGSPTGLVPLCNQSEEHKDESWVNKDGQKDCALPSVSSASASDKTQTHFGAERSSVGSSNSRPSSLSSLKRPANLPTGKSSGKESKLPKVLPARPTLASKNSTVLKANHVKHNQFTQPGSSTAGDSSFHSSRGSNAHSLPLPRRPPANKRATLDGKVKPSALKIISDDMQPARTIDAFVAKVEPKFCAAVPLRNLPVQTIKPSGLRMPSPSLSVFSQSNRSVSCGISPGETETALLGPKEPLKLRLKEESRTPNDAKGTCDGISASSEVERQNGESSVIPNLEQKCSKATKIPKPKLSRLSKNQDSELRSDHHCNLPKSVAMSKINKLASVEKEKNSSVLNQRAVVLDARIQSDLVTQIEETDLRHNNVSDSKETAGPRSLEALDCCKAESSDSKQTHPGEPLAGGISAVEASSNQNTNLVSQMRCETEEAVAEDGCAEVRSQSPIKATEVVAPSASNSNKQEEVVDSKSHCKFVPPENVAPFSDEWLAAIEAAGEDILSKKGGAVQNSPPEKPSQPEPSPWSPVKKKNGHQIGPYDCTKFTNNVLPDEL